MLHWCVRVYVIRLASCFYFVCHFYASLSFVVVNERIAMQNDDDDEHQEQQHTKKVNLFIFTSYIKTKQKNMVVHKRNKSL